MPEITIKVFHCVDSERKLMRTIRVKPVSGKTLNGSRAASILRREFPRLDLRPLVKSDNGWLHMRALEPKPNSSYHYKWEHIHVYQEL
jgi:hypothetical protein